MWLYESEWSRIWHGTAESLLESKEIKRSSLDLLVTDPPYGQSWSSGRRKSEGFGIMLNDDGTYDPEPTIELAIRKFVRNGRHIYVFGPFDLQSLSIGGSTKIIWDKEILGPGDLSTTWGPQHEEITFGVIVRSKANRNDGYGKLSARLRKGSVVRAQRPQSRRAKYHPSEKPVLLLQQLIESSSIVGDTVFDPYAGSGSTGVAAIMTGRRIVMAEMDQKYVNISITRIKEVEKIYDQIRLL